MGLGVAKKWEESAPKEPRYYMGDEAPVYYYSATDALLRCRQHLHTGRPTLRASWNVGSLTGGAASAGEDGVAPGRGGIAPSTLPSALEALDVDTVTTEQIEPLLAPDRRPTAAGDVALHQQRSGMGGKGEHRQAKQGKEQSPSDPDMFAMNDADGKGGHNLGPLYNTSLHHTAAGPPVAVPRRLSA